MAETLNISIDTSRAPDSFDPDGSVFTNGVRNDKRSMMVVSDADAILKIDKAAVVLDKNLKRERHEATWVAASRF